MGTTLSRHRRRSRELLCDRRDLDWLRDGGQRVRHFHSDRDAASMRVLFQGRRAGTWLFLGLVLANPGGCTGPTELDQYQLPAEDLSLDPTHLTTPRLLWGCSGWGPDGQPASRFVLADLTLWRVPGRPPRPPTGPFHQGRRTGGGQGPLSVQLQRDASLCSDRPTPVHRLVRSGRCRVRRRQSAAVRLARSGFDARQPDRVRPCQIPCLGRPDNPQFRCQLCGNPPQSVGSPSPT